MRNVYWTTAIRKLTSRLRFGRHAHVSSALRCFTPQTPLRHLCYDINLEIDEIQRNGGANYFRALRHKTTKT